MCTPTPSWLSSLVSEAEGHTGSQSRKEPSSDSAGGWDPSLGAGCRLQPRYRALSPAQEGPPAARELGLPGISVEPARGTRALRGFV